MQKQLWQGTIFTGGNFGLLLCHWIQSENLGRNMSTWCSVFSLDRWTLKTKPKPRVNLWTEIMMEKPCFRMSNAVVCSSEKCPNTCPKEIVLQRRNFENLEALNAHGLKAIWSQSFEWKINNIWVTNTFIKLLTFLQYVDRIPQVSGHQPPFSITNNKEYFICLMSFSRCSNSSLVNRFRKGKSLKVNKC